MLGIVCILLFGVINAIFYDLSNGDESLKKSILDAMDPEIDPCEDAHFHSRLAKIGNATYDRLMHVYLTDGDPQITTFSMKCVLVNQTEELGWLQNTYFDHIDSLSSKVDLMYFLGNFHADTMTLFGESSFASSELGFLFDFGLLEYTYDGSRAEVTPLVAPHVNLDVKDYKEEAEKSEKVKNYKIIAKTFFDTIGQPGYEEIMWANEKAFLQYVDEDNADLLKTNASGMALTTGMDWMAYFHGLKLGHGGYQKLMVVDTPEYKYFKAIPKILASIGEQDIKNMLKFNIFYGLSKLMLDDDLASSDCYHLTYNVMMQHWIKVFTTKYFDDAKNTQKRVFDMIDGLADAYDATFAGDDWMSDKVREYAKFKLGKMKKYALMPDAYAPFEDIVKDGKPLFEMMMEIGTYLPRVEFVPNLGNKTTYTPYWTFGGGMAMAVNAFNQPQKNSIVILPAILQNPVYDDAFPDVLLYSRLGAIIGHEVGHSFDNNGRMYNAYGDRFDWWDKSSTEKFNSKAQCLVDQYNKFYMPYEPSKHINGKHTLGENIADNAGTAASYKAFAAALGKGSKHMTDPSALVPKFTYAQLYYITYSQVWCESNRIENLEDEHSPGRFRPQGVAQNSQEFADAFSCKYGDYMDPPKEKKCVMF